jgi:hypothetical protein
MISLPVAAIDEMFRWQLDLFWFGHLRQYQGRAFEKAHAIIMRRNDFWAPKVDRMPWEITIPHSLCEPFFDLPAPVPHASLMYNTPALALPLNIQLGLEQILPKFADDDILEVCDCDMVHFRPAPVKYVQDNELLVADVYENWHLLSRTSNRHVIEPYFENGGAYYNGGFVPIIGRAKTFRKILPEWIAVHINLLGQPFSKNIHWWSGMYALQAACEKARVHMIARDFCYVPGANQLTPTQYIGHYAIDPVFNKRSYPQIDLSRFDPHDPYYRLIRQWIEHRAAGQTS